MSFGSNADYAEIFAARGALYHRAMQQFPDARREEFHALVDYAGINAGETVCDAPAGGGYLARHLPPDCPVCYVETAPEFVRDSSPGSKRRMVMGQLAALPLADRSRDHVVSLAGLHHVEDKAGFFREAARVLRPGGTLTCGDVWHDSPVRHFLDEFVGAHNDTGHSGWYFHEGTATEISDLGFRDVRLQRIPFAWKFDTANDLTTFCSLLFGMDASGRDRMLQAARKYLGAVDDRNLPWELCFIRAIR